MKQDKVFAMLVLVASISFVDNVLAQPQAKFMAVRVAEDTARAALAESLVGLDMASEATISNMIGQFTVSSEVKARLKGVEFVDPMYDPETGIARVTAQMKGAKVRNIKGELVDLGGRTFTRVGFGASTDEGRASIKALRAATIDAYRKLAEYFGGITIEGETTVNDYVLKSDRIKASFVAALFGANLAKGDAYGFDEDGTAYMRLTLSVGDVQDVLNQTLSYNEKEVTVTGHAVRAADPVSEPITDTKESKTEVESYIAAEVQDGPLGIPVQPVRPSGTPTERPSAAAYGGVQSR